jgi:antibiotic biosynthesis monooxygenase (ABM) superfamily enzyme
MTKSININQAIELIRLKVMPENTEAFLEGRKAVDAFVGTLGGYIGTELIQISETDWLMQIRWADQASVEAAQKVTESASIISDWINKTSTFVSFDTAYVRYVH